MSHKVLQCHLDLTSLVNKLATVLDLINEGSDHAVAVLDLALALVEKEPDLAPGPGLYIDCHKLFAILLFAPMCIVFSVSTRVHCVLLSFLE